MNDELKNKEPLLVSACLLGFDCKYSGGSNSIGEAVIADLKEKYRVIPVCPEFSGGLPTPRDPSERIGDRVMSDHGADVTSEFERGAHFALTLCRRFGCRKALLKEQSPSCGFGIIYDGTFTGKLIPGDGVTAQLLAENGIRIIGEKQVNTILQK